MLTEQKKAEEFNTPIQKQKGETFSKFFNPEELANSSKAKAEKV